MTRKNSVFEHFLRRVILQACNKLRTVIEAPKKSKYNWILRNFTWSLLIESTAANPLKLIIPINQYFSFIQARVIIEVPHFVEPYGLDK